MLAACKVHFSELKCTSSVYCRRARAYICIYILIYACRNNLSTSFKMIIFLYCLKASVRALLCVDLSHARVSASGKTNNKNMKKKSSAASFQCMRTILPYALSRLIATLIHIWNAMDTKQISSHREQLHHGDSINSNSRACDMRYHSRRK